MVASPIMQQWRKYLPYALVALVALLILGANAVAAYRQASRISFQGGPLADWPVYGQDQGGSRYSPIQQINRDNVALLQVAWEYHTGDFADGSDGRPGTSFQATPILVDGRLYLSTAYNRVIALDPTTGAEIWAYDPGIDRTVHRAEIASRGVTAWLDTQRGEGETCRRRIFLGTLDARLIALDAASGKPCPDFGNQGTVDLAQGAALGSYVPDTTRYGVTSPVVAIDDLVVVGSAVGDNRAVTVERGVVRAYDARTGALRWSFDPIPRNLNDPARQTWADDSADRTGAANVWAQISADPERDLVFIPTSSPSPDYYGGERRGSNLYADSVVALRGATGEMVWHYQLVHHNIWDYDIPAQPTLVTVRKDGQEIPAVAQANKTGFLFLLNRETGEPIFPVEERPVPQSDVPGEESWPTQPFPTAPQPLARMHITPDDAWGLSPWDRGQCRNRIAQLRNDGIFTPASLQGSLMFPGIAGGTNWGSLAFEPARGWVVLNMTHLPFVIEVIPRQEFAAAAARSGDAEVSPQAGTPYGMSRVALLSPLGLPCLKPPWGTLATVELATGQVKWEVPLGTIRDIAPVPLPWRLGVPNQGGPIVTAGGLVLIGAAMDNYLRAFDVETGAELWKGRLPAGGQATPMTYRLAENGRQFVVIAAGGHAKLGTTIGDSVVAFALPESRLAVVRQSILDLLPAVGLAVVVACLLIALRAHLLNRWLWLVGLGILVLVATELVWLATLSAAAMILALALGVGLAFLLLHWRGYLART
ncbi:MAG: pyrroloquinoline quinone-dependent dehydrogenase [Caldilinea sp. CFX5]|nr:pyrroloquinoline quinone-dependent dehydrogenase [Caldilinea sp. CFX5]